MGWLFPVFWFISPASPRHNLRQQAGFSGFPPTPWVADFSIGRQYCCSGLLLTPIMGWLL